MRLGTRTSWSSLRYPLLALVLAGASLGRAMGQSVADKGKVGRMANKNAGSPAQTQKESPLEVRVEADRRSYRVGTYINIAVLLKNTSGDPLYLYAELGWGASASLFLFVRDAVSREFVRQNFIADELPPPPTSKDDFIQLRPGYVYGTELGVSLRELGIERRGTYDLEVVYHSPSPMAYGFGLPIFSREMGEISAKPVRITVTD